jgi:hypothetical protein
MTGPHEGLRGVDSHGCCPDVVHACDRLGADFVLAHGGTASSVMAVTRLTNSPVDNRGTWQHSSKIVEDLLNRKG